MLLLLSMVLCEIWSNFAISSPLVVLFQSATVSLSPARQPFIEGKRIGAAIGKPASLPASSGYLLERNRRRRRRRTKLPQRHRAVAN